MVSAEALQRIVSALSQRLGSDRGGGDEAEMQAALGALVHILQCEEARDAVLSVGDARLGEMCKELNVGLSRAVGLEVEAAGIAAVAVFGSVCQSERARQLMLQHSDTEPIFQSIPAMIRSSAGAGVGAGAGLSAECPSVPLAVAQLTRYPSAQRRVLASGRCTKLLAGLRELLAGADARLASDAAEAVGNLVFNDEGRYQVVACEDLKGVFAGLVALLKSPEDTAGNAAWAVGNLCRDPGFASRLVKDEPQVGEVLRSLARLVGSEDCQTACDATCALAVLAETMDGHTRFGLLDEDEIALLLATLADNVATRPPSVGEVSAVVLKRLHADKAESLSPDARELVRLMLETVDEQGACCANMARRGLTVGHAGGSLHSLGPMVGRRADGYGEGDGQKEELVMVRALDGRVVQWLPLAALGGAESDDEDEGGAGSGDEWEESAAAEVTAALTGPSSPSLASKVAPQGSNGAAAVNGSKGDRAERSKVNGASGADAGAGAGKAAGKAATAKQEDPAPEGAVVETVQLISSAEHSLTVSWRPPYPERTESCRFVCDAGNGGHYRNVATLAREALGEDGVFRCEISGLAPGREYRVLAIARTSFVPCHGALTMFDTKGVFKTVASPPECPAPPVLSSRTRTALKIRWVAPSGCGHDITAYEVQMCRGTPGDDAAWEAVTDASEPATAVRLKAAKLTPGHVYAFRVRACNEIGWGAWSEAGVYSTSASVPSAPTGLAAVAAGGGQLRVSWEAAAGNGDPVSSYILEQDDGAGGSFAVIYNGPEEAFVVGGLMAGRAYKFRVKACNGEGHGQYCAAVEASGNSSRPAACDAPTLVRARSTALALRWPEPDCCGAEIRSYRVELGEGADAAGGFAKAWAGPERSCEITAGLAPGRTYSLRVVAMNAVGEGPPGAAAAFETEAEAPAAPHGLMVVTRGSSSARLRWKAPASNGAALTGVRIEVDEVGKGTRSIALPAAALDHEVQDLALDRLSTAVYTVRVRAANRVGLGPPSDPVRLAPQLAPPCPPGPPRLQFARPTVLGVRWEPPIIPTPSMPPQVHASRSPPRRDCAGSGPRPCSVSLSLSVSVSVSVSLSERPTFRPRELSAPRARRRPWRGTASRRRRRRRCRRAPRPSPRSSTRTSAARSSRGFARAWRTACALRRAARRGPRSARPQRCSARRAGCRRPRACTRRSLPMGSSRARRSARGSFPRATASPSSPRWITAARAPQTFARPTRGPRRTLRSRCAPGPPTNSACAPRRPRGRRRGRSSKASRAPAAGPRACRCPRAPRCGWARAGRRASRGRRPRARRRRRIRCGSTCKRARSCQRKGSKGSKGRARSAWRWCARTSWRVRTASRCAPPPSPPSPY